MAKRPKHCVACWLFLDNPYPIVHIAMDRSSRTLGKEHRSGEFLTFHTIEDLIFMIHYYRHADWISNNEMQFWLNTSPEKILAAGSIHIVQDDIIRGLRNIEEEITNGMKGSWRQVEGFTEMLIQDVGLSDNWWKEIVNVWRKLFGVYTREGEEVKFLDQEDDPNPFELFLDCSEHWGGYDKHIQKRIDYFRERRGNKFPNLSHLYITKSKFEHYKNGDAQCSLASDKTCLIKSCQYR